MDVPFHTRCGKPQKAHFLISISVEYIWKFAGNDDSETISTPKQNTARFASMLITIFFYKLLCTNYGQILNIYDRNVQFRSVNIWVISMVPFREFHICGTYIATGKQGWHGAWKKYCIKRNYLTICDRTMQTHKA